MPMPKEFRSLLEPFLAAGFTLAPRRRSTHTMVLDPQGRVATVIPSTPSDHRTYLNCRADLRRAARALEEPTRCG